MTLNVERHADLLSFGLRYSAHRRYDGVEVMVYCDGLNYPDEVRPFRGEAA